MPHSRIFTSDVVNLVGLVDVGKDFEEGGFSRAVSADDAEKFAFFDLEGNVVEGIEFFIRCVLRLFCRDALQCVFVFG